jgi:cytochrome b
MRRVLVWDLPTRVFHWLLVALVVLAFVTAEMGGTAMQYHMWNGAAILGLVLFRVLWGFWGGTQSRFSAFVKGPGKTVEYARTLLGGKSKKYLGHNPLGAWSIIAMLAALAIQAGTGLFANDDILTEGPLFQWVSKDTSDWLTRIHLINQNILIGLVVLHIGAILFYLVVKRENLLLPMITGHKQWHEAAIDADDHRFRAIILVAILAAGVYWIIF